MANKDNVHDIYVTLDSLMDTRLAVLGQLSSTLAERLLTSGDYLKREHNCFSVYDPTFDDAAFERTYKARDVETLKQAMTTEIVPMLMDMVMRYRVGKDIPGDEMQIKLTLNIWPYRLNDEASKTFANMLKGSTYCDEVKVINTDIAFCDGDNLAKYDTIIMDDFDAWSLMHAEKMTHGPLRRRQVNAPLVIRDPKTQRPAIPTEAIGGVARMCFAELMELELLPLNFFSIRTAESIKSHSP